MVWVIMDGLVIEIQKSGMPRYAQFYKVAASIQSRRPFFERMGWESNKTIGHILSKGIEKEPFFKLAEVFCPETAKQ